MLSLAKLYFSTQRPQFSSPALRLNIYCYKKINSMYQNHYSYWEALKFPFDMCIKWTGLCLSKRDTSGQPVPHKCKVLHSSYHTGSPCTYWSWGAIWAWRHTLGACVSKVYHATHTHTHDNLHAWTCVCAWYTLCTFASFTHYLIILCSLHLVESIFSHLRPFSY